MDALRCLAVSSASTISSFSAANVATKKHRACRSTQRSTAVLRVTCESSAESTMSRPQRGADANKESLDASWRHESAVRSPYLAADPAGFAGSSVFFPSEPCAPVDDETMRLEDYVTRLTDKEMWGDVPVAEFMSADVVCLQRRTPLRVAAQVFASLRISGAPVVEPYEDGSDSTGFGRLVGVLSERDFMWKEMKPYPSEEDKIHRLSCYYGNLNQGPMVDTLRHLTSKIMSTTVRSVLPSCVRFCSGTTRAVYFLNIGSLPRVNATAEAVVTARHTSPP
eukprot:TRINITY_DN1325_c0_g1_i2.p1 TRINITY_DN1325_c0_g1~~TRINITY_DN1325_c0_g1_i2.p1  ORF type:complete len:280 (-),score=-19.07 TRINITY_DN1325_c0_g1_i2:808-1647(-)